MMAYVVCSLNYGCVEYGMLQKRLHCVITIMHPLHYIVITLQCVLHNLRCVLQA